MRTLLVVLLCCLMDRALAETRVGVRVGDHPTHGRLVLDWPQPPAFEVETTAGVTRLRFAEEVVFDPGLERRPPRNIAAITPVPQGLDIAVRPGARARVYRLGSRIVIDVFATEPPAVRSPDAAPTAAVPAAAARAGRATPGRGRPAVASVVPLDPPAAPAPTRAAARVPATERAAEKHGVAPPPAAAPAAASATSSTSSPDKPLEPAPPPAPPAPAPLVAPVPLQLPGADAVPVRVRAIPGELRAVPLPFAPTTGAAAFRRGDTLLVAFDQPLALDLTPLRRDPVFATLETKTVANGTVLRLALAPPSVLRLRREGPAWLLEAGLADDPRLAAAADAILPEAVVGAGPVLSLVARGPGMVLPLTDPLTGLPLLLGTVRETGQRLVATRRLGAVDLLETQLGVAVLARSDTVTLRAAADRFLLDGSVGLAALGGGTDADAAAMTRSFDLPAIPLVQLAERQRSERAGISAASPLGRYPLRITAAQTLLALGQPQEALAMLTIAAAEDPRASTDPQAMALGGMAALLAGRPAEAEGLVAAPLPPTDELQLWQSLLLAARGDVTAAAPGLAAALPLLLGYPEPLRQRLLPVAAEALAEGGAQRALRRLLGTVPDDALPLPRGMLAEAEGAPKAALAAYAAAAEGRDRRARARALRRSIELRLAQGELDELAAARALETTLFAWRDDVEEIATRRRIAALRTGSDARGALALLRETEALFPEQAATLFAPMQAAFVEALRQEPPLAAVALYDAYPELLPTSGEIEAAVGRLADALVTLDLADRAATLLRGAAERAPSMIARASLGLRWATLVLEAGDVAAAGAALAATDTAPLPATLRRDRGMLAARIQLRAGEGDAAIATLRGLGTDAAGALIDLLSDRGDWAAAAAEHGPQLRALLPTAPAPLPNEAARAAVRQAALLALAGDESAIAGLRRELAHRLPEPALREAFAALTASQLRGLGDLPRLQQELALFRSLPTRLEALRAGAPITR